jgi:Aerotolerance regulator N-terminal
MLAIVFLNPLLLTGLGLAAAPIIIHLLSRRQYRRVEWGAMRFLLEAEKRNRRRVRFEQWLLVALRCLAMALLALLLSRPFVRSGLVATLLGSGPAPQRVLLIDDSASLAYQSGGKATDFDAVRAAALRTIEWLRQEQAAGAVTLYATAADEPLLRADELSFGVAEDLRQAIAQRRTSDVRAAPRRLMEKLVREHAATGAAQPVLLYVFSDFQRSDWLATSDEGNAFEPLREMPAESLRVVLVPTAAAARPNAAIVAAELERPQVIAGLPVLIRATIANYTGQPLSAASARIEVDGAPSAATPIDAIEAGRTRTLALEATLPDEGYREVTLVLDATDGLAADNRRSVGMRVRSALEVLLVSGQAATDAARDETYLLRSALSPPGPFSSGMRIETIDDGELETTDLSRFDCVALCNIAPPAEPTAAHLLRYVNLGGGVLIFAGEQNGDGVEFSRVLHAGGAGVLPLALDGVQRAEGAGVALLRGQEHPATAVFPGDGALSERVRFRAFARLIAAPASAPSSAASEGPHILARFADAAQSPALVEKSIGRGRCLLFASTADLDWNDWARAADGSYVVAMLDWVQYVARRGNDALNVRAGQAAELRLDSTLYEPAARLRPPAGSSAAVASLAAATSDADGEARFVTPPIANCGTWSIELQRRGGGEEIRPLTVSFDPRESDLAVLSPQELDAALGPVPHEIITAADALPADASDSRRELWPALLLLLTAVLMAEQTLAWWFGRPPSTTRRPLVGLRAAKAQG